MGVALLEQPIRVGDEPGLDGYRSPIPLCADELINDERDLGQAQGRFDCINIKLDKAGGLTAALHLAEAASAAGMKLMVGCMVGSSLSMAPGTVLAQRCAFVDLDGPLLQSEDWVDGLRYEAGRVFPPSPRFWG
jgi:L-alanine-DL-glutamate epimerase-like enolase superfamily enzyme